MGRNNLTHLLAAGTVGSGRPGSRFAASTSDPLTNRVRPKAIFTVGLGVMLRVRHGHLIQVVPEAIALSTVLKPTVKLCQRDALEGANDVVGAFGGEETFVIAGTEVPVRTFVILVAIESPDAADYDQTTDPVVPEIADVMKTEIGSCVSAFESDVDLYMGIGGSPEAVLAAAGIKCLGGEMQCKMWPRDDKEQKQLIADGNEKDLDHVFTADDLAQGENIVFCATGISDSALLRGVKSKGMIAITHSILMRAKSKTVRLIRAMHNLQNKTIRLRSDNREHLI